MADSIAALESFAAALYRAAGMDDAKAASVARLQVLTDAMGHRTHGLAMAPLYLAEIAKGGMAVSGEPRIVSDNGHVAVWDGRYLPGPWLAEQAIHAALPRASKTGIAAVAIRRSHHIGCLAALVKQAADLGYVALIANSDPAEKSLFTPNPLAVGWPGRPNPVLVEQVGGTGYGHDGYGLALIVEALSQGLAGHGRKDAPARWGGNVFLQVIDPELFAGADAYAEQTQFFAAQCRANRPLDPSEPVRVPGDAAAHGIVQAEAEGITYDTATAAALRACAARLNVPLPDGLQAA